MPTLSNALNAWTFAAAAICHFESSESECDGASAKLRTVAVKLAYRIEFTQQDGVKAVKQQNLGRRQKS